MSTDVLRDPPAPNQLPVHYSSAFFAERAEGSHKSSEVVVPHILSRLPVQSVVDVGCGIGSWLATFAKYGVANIHGIDGGYVDRSLLRIPRSSFAEANLEEPITPTMRFDLAVCLEVAEHLPPSSAPILVKSLTGLSDVVLFSAAPPGQGGTNHVNEQWPDYWAMLFEARGYQAIDCIRSLTWDDPEIDWWYAQNTILYATPLAIATNPDLVRGQLCGAQYPMRLVHPRSLAHVRKEMQLIWDHSWTPGVAWCSRALMISVCNAIRRRLPSRTSREK